MLLRRFFRSPQNVIHTALKKVRKYYLHYLQLDPKMLLRLPWTRCENIAQIALKRPIKHYLDHTEVGSELLVRSNLKTYQTVT